MSRPLRRALEVGAFLLWCFVLVEGLLWVASRVSPAVASRLGDRVAEPGHLEDPVLGRVGNPAAPGHDARGFRNEEALERAAIVTLGDSQTMGQGAPRDVSWPAHLERMVGAPVYNMGVIDTGPVYYHHLVDTALELDPDWVLTGFYLGNDLWNVLDEHYVRRIPGLDDGVPRDPATEAAVRERAELYATATGEHIDRRDAGSPAAADAPEPDPLARAAAFARERSRTWRAVAAIRAALATRLSGEERDRGAPKPVDPARWRRTKAALADVPGVVTFEANGVRTVLDPGYRILGEDVLGDSLIAEGLDRAIEAIGRIDARVEAAGARHLVVLVPSKEALFAGLLDPAGLDPALERLAANEERIRAIAAERFEALGIEWVDAAAEMRAAVGRGVQIYPPSVESHPNGAGYEAIAEAARRGLAERGFERSPMPEAGT